MSTRRPRAKGVYSVRRLWSWLNIRHIYVDRGFLIHEAYRSFYWVYIRTEKVCILPWMKSIRALFSACLYFLCDVAVGVGESDARDQNEYTRVTKWSTPRRTYYMSVLHRELESKSELLFVLKLMRNILFFCAARLLIYSSDDALFYSLLFRGTMVNRTKYC